MCDDSNTAKLTPQQQQQPQPQQSQQPQQPQPQQSQQPQQPQPQPQQQQAENEVKNLASYFREQGNKHFRRENWKTALQFYTTAIEHDKNDEHSYLNISAAQLKLGAFTEAKMRANTVLHLSKGKNAKAWLRRGFAFGSLGDVVNAYYDFLSAQSIWPNDEQIRKAAAHALSQIEKNCKQFEKEQKQKSLNFWMNELGEFKNDYLQSTNTVITELCLSNKPTSVIVACLRILLLQKISVERIEILKTRLTLNVAVALKAYLSSITSLHRLSLASTSLGPYTMSLLVEPLKKQKNLTSLDLSSCSLRHFGCISLKSLLSTPDIRLKTLHLSNNGFGKNALNEIVSAILINKSVETIYLNNNNFSEDSISLILSIFADDYPKLEFVSLANNNIPTCALLKIVNLFFDRPHIQALDLDGMHLPLSDQTDIQLKVKQHHKNLYYNKEIETPHEILQHPYQKTQLYW
eukprot:TRINITY_DN1391_c0_g1_i2.p1 TRINITY_DN1391_c0_g1~~TRINITY_DN1391_c0_g1_i2.p1  ORF type:complete len:524 (-),score=132.02 TRINITY_DN1391_c0_g1_i2:219-1604(-)